MEYYPFDSRSGLYRSHIGAAASGKSLRLRLLLHNDAHCHAAFLRLRRDDGGAVEEIGLTGREFLEDYRFYDCELSLPEGLYWYSFRYTSDYGEYFVTKAETSVGIVSETGGWWQQTVYEADFSVPDWLEGGVIYQIFPDRFYNSGNEKAGVPADRFLCSDWRKLPEHRQNNGICSLGNDYYGGDLRGITEKLPYLESLGVTCIYMNPVFEAHSNHRYNTADYKKIDPLLGSESDLEELCREGKKRGISVILDGVFSHTGDDSVYFDRRCRYGSDGAYGSPDSPYHGWYKFRRFPDDYTAWWNVPSLPETNETDPGFLEFITGENGVLRYWLKKGIRGWRLDVADELPDSFLDNVRKAVKAERGDSFLLGEVWEDASNKISYGVRRRFLRGRQLDSVMNYPLANGIITFVRDGGAAALTNLVLDISENYPPGCVHLLMNHIGTHDTVRLITRLVRGDENRGDREWQSRQSLSKAEYEHGRELVKMAALIQYTLPGVPSVFYGDEAGVQGYGDPFCRATYPWGTEDSELIGFYTALGTMRRSCPAFRHGDFVPLLAEGDTLIYERTGENAGAVIAVNRGESPVEARLPSGFTADETVFGDAPEGDRFVLPPHGIAVYISQIRA